MINLYCVSISINSLIEVPLHWAEVFLYNVPHGLMLTLTLQEMDIHVNIGTPQDTQMKTKIIVELLQVIQIMLEVHGVIHLVVQESGYQKQHKYR
jgi:hypothetical protein